MHDDIHGAIHSSSCLAPTYLLGPYHTMRLGSMYRDLAYNETGQIHRNYMAAAPTGTLNPIRSDHLTNTARCDTPGESAELNFAARLSTHGTRTACLLYAQAY